MTNQVIMFEVVTFIGVIQRLVQVISKKGVVCQSKMNTFSNWPRAFKSSNYTMHNSLNMPTESPKSSRNVSEIINFSLIYMTKITARNKIVLNLILIKVDNNTIYLLKQIIQYFIKTNHKLTK